MTKKQPTAAGGLLAPSQRPLYACAVLLRANYVSAPFGPPDSCPQLSLLQLDQARVWRYHRALNRVTLDG